MSSSTKQSRKEKIEYLEILEEKERRRTADPLKYAKYHDKQEEFFKAQEAIRALFWGNRVGKTEGGAQEAARYLENNHPYRTIGDGVEIWAVCPSFEAQEETTQKKLLSYLAPSKIDRIEYIRGKIIRKIVMKNGSFVTFKSYEQGREKFQGAGKRLIWFDEEPPKDIWEECFVRVEAGVQLDVILTMTAIKGMTWVYKDIYKDTANPDLFVSTAGWDDNPWLTKAQLTQMSRGLSKAALQVRREGKFVKRVGLVCSWFERDVHLRDYTELPQSWTYFEVLDGGFSDPAAYLLIGVDGDDNVHIVDGFREKGLLTDAIAERRNTKASNLMITKGYVDTDNPRMVEELAKLGMRLNPIEKDSKENQSWDEILAEKLEEYGAVQPGTGEPRLYISKKLVRVDEETGNEVNWLMGEIEELTWLEKVTKEGEEIKPKWNDHRRLGHHFDGIRALSYFLVSYKKPIKKKRSHKQSKRLKFHV